MPNELLQEFKSWQESVGREINITKTLIEQLRAQVETPHKGSVTAASSWNSPGRQVVEAKGFLDLLKTTGRGRFEVSGLWPEAKTAITEAAAGSSTPGVLSPSRLDGIVPAARRRLTIRDVLPQRTVNEANAVEWVKENAFTNAASPQTEASDKAESALTFTISHVHFSTVAHWIPASRQILSDLPGVRQFIDETLLYGLKLREEQELLSGDGLGDHQSGLITQATAYGGAYNVAGDTRLDRLRWAVLELALGSETATAIILNPVDLAYIDHQKDETNGANTGRYIVGDPLGGGPISVRTLWGLPVVETLSMTSGKFLVFNAAATELVDRQTAVIEASESHSDYWVKNLVALRCEERVALCVKRSTFGVYGSF